MTLDAMNDARELMFPPTKTFVDEHGQELDLSILPKTYRDLIEQSATPADPDDALSAGERLDNFVTRKYTDARNWIKMAPYNYITQCQSLRDPRLIRACLRASLWASNHLGTYHQETAWPDPGQGAFGDDAQTFENFRALQNPPPYKAKITFSELPYLCLTNLKYIARISSYIASIAAASYAARQYAIPYYKRQQHKANLDRSNKLRSTFRKYQAPNLRTTPTNDKLGSTHPLEATNRNIIYNSVDRFLTANGIIFFELHQGHHQGPGYQDVHVASDLTKKITELPFELYRPHMGKHYSCDPDFGLCDVILLSLCDWFVDLQEILAYGKPVVIITKECYKLTYRNSEVSMKAGHNDLFHFDVLGGGQYSHHLHRFDRDYISGPLENPLSSPLFLGHYNYIPDQP